MEFAYSQDKKHFSLKALCRTLAHEYGPGISVTSLQSAILARFSMYLPPTQFAETMNYHKERAWRELIRKMQTPSQVQAADFFAAYILATMAWDEENDEETLIHYRGCLSIWHYLTRVDNRASNILIVFGPMVLDNLSFADRMACITRPNSWDSIIQPPTTFSERVQYFEKLQPKCLDRASPGLVEAVHDLMDDMLSLLVMVIVEIAREEAVGIYDRSQKILSVIQYVKEQLAMPEFRKAVHAVNQISEEFNNEHYDLVICLRLQLKLAVLILREKTLSDGLEAPTVNAKAEEFIRHFQIRIRPSTPIRPKYYVGGLMLAGMGMSRVMLEQCMFPKDNDNTDIRPRVVDPRVDRESLRRRKP